MNRINTIPIATPVTRGITVNASPDNNNATIVIAMPIYSNPSPQIVLQSRSSQAVRGNRYNFKSIKLCLFGNQNNKKRTAFAFFVLGIFTILIIDLSKIKVNGKPLAFEHMILPLTGIFFAINFMLKLCERNRFDLGENN